MSGLGPKRLAQPPNFWRAHALLFNTEPQTPYGASYIHEHFEPRLVHHAGDGRALARLIITQEGPDQLAEVFVVVAGANSASGSSSDAWRFLHESLASFAQYDDPLHFVGLGSYAAMERSCFVGGVTGADRRGRPLRHEFAASDYAVVNINTLSSDGAQLETQRVVVKLGGFHLFWRDWGAWSPVRLSQDAPGLFQEKQFLGMIPDPKGNDLLVCSDRRGNAVCGRLVRQQGSYYSVTFEPCTPELKLPGIVRGTQCNEAGHLCVMLHELMEDERASRVTLIPAYDVWKQIYVLPTA